MYDIMQVQSDLVRQLKVEVLTAELPIKNHVLEACDGLEGLLPKGFEAAEAIICGDKTKREDLVQVVDSMKNTLAETSKPKIKLLKAAHAQVTQIAITCLIRDLKEQAVVKLTQAYNRDNKDELERVWQKVRGTQANFFRQAKNVLKEKDEPVTTGRRVKDLIAQMEALSRSSSPKDPNTIKKLSEGISQIKDEFNDSILKAKLPRAQVTLRNIKMFSYWELAQCGSQKG